MYENCPRRYYYQRITKEVKVINSGELKKAIKIKGLKISKSALEEVKKSGGEVG